MKRKITNPITNQENNTSKVSDQSPVKQLFLGEYFNIHTFQKHPITPNFFINEAKLLKEWSEQDDSLRIQDFYDMRGYEPKMYYEWVDKFEEMRLADEYALRRIGSRREGGALNRKFAETTVHKTLGHYDKIWREEMRLVNEARISINAQSQNESKMVIIERFPSMSGGHHDVEVISTSKYTPEEVAANIRRNTATDRQVRVNGDVGESYE